MNKDCRIYKEIEANCNRYSLDYILGLILLNVMDFNS